MNHNLMLRISSLLSILFLTLHLTSDALRARAGTSEAGGSTMVAVPVLVLLLYGTLVLGERMSGIILMLIGSIIAMGMPVIHVRGVAGVFHAVLAKSNGDYLFVWTLHMLGVIGMFSFILALHVLFSRQRRQTRS
jgi:membrane-bound ClpP family serine protease